MVTKYELGNSAMCIVDNVGGVIIIDDSQDAVILTGMQVEKLMVAVKRSKKIREMARRE